MRHLPGYLDSTGQRALAGKVADILHLAPLFQPFLPRWGTPLSVRMSNCGPLGWVADKSGYRYQPIHPDTGQPWPPMPGVLEDLWDAVTGYDAPPEACLINYYAPGAKMGLHQDKDEADFEAPVVSISLGDRARFRLGGSETRKGPAQSVWLESGDVIVLEGPTRLAFHGIDKVEPGNSNLLSGWPDLFPNGGRLNLTLRRITLP